MRNPVKPDQYLHFEHTYQGFPVLTHRGPLIEQYLYRLHRCIARGLDQYSRLYVIRFDLRLPEYAPARTNSCMGRFVASLKAKLEHSQARRERDGTRTHDSRLRFFWCREISQEQGVHFHCALMLNGHAYAHIGDFDLRADNLYARIHEAWASAHEVHVRSVLGSIHFPENPDYMVRRADQRSQEDVFKRLSYLCKAATKDHGDRRHVCGWSRG